MIYQALKTWFQTYGVLLKLLMIDMHYEVSYIGDNNVMRKHGYGYLEEIVVRRADNALYRFKVRDDVADFAIALRMFTRSLVIQRGVKDVQLGVKSYQKKINVTKPDTTRPDLRKRHPHNKNITWCTYRREKMEKFGKEKSSHFKTRNAQQAAKGKEDDEEFGEIH
ncbi:hypothetical protein Tco_0408434 [Tanacetum coccineum]